MVDMRFACLLLLFSLRMAASTLFVALEDGKFPRAGQVDGNDVHSPFKSVGSALAAVRALQAKPGFAEDVTIQFALGRFELSAPIDVTAADWSSPGGHRLTFRGASGNRTVLSGGIRVTHWRQDSKHPEIWTAPLPLSGENSWEPHQMVWDKRLLHRARTPNNGYFTATGILGTNSPMTVPCTLSDLAGLSRDFGGWFVCLNRWVDIRFPFKTVDEARQMIVIDCKPRFFLLDEPHARYWIENVPEALDEPGEWLWDARKRSVSVFVPLGGDPNRSEFIASRLPVLVNLHGTADQPLKNVSFEQLVLSDADCVTPAEGHGLDQSAATVPGNIRADYASGIRIDGCEIRNCAGYALEFKRGCHACEISGNHIYNIGTGGIKIGEANGPDDPVHGTYGTRFSDNNVHALGRLFNMAAGVLILQSGTNTISHNAIYDLYYTAISAGWTWGYQPSACRANLIEYNHLWLVGQGRLSDLSGVYTLGPQPGTTVRYNLIHDVRCHLYGGWGLYTDEGSTGILMENNVAYRCQSAGFHQHYGADNLVQNNILAWNLQHTGEMSRLETHRSFWFYNNIMAASSGDFLTHNWGPGVYESDGNVWYDSRWKEDISKYRFAGDTWEQWHQRGRDVHSVIADPRFIDPDHPEKGLRSDSPAFALGFHSFDLRDVGPRVRHR